MNITEKRTLVLYLKLHQPAWEITSYQGHGCEGLYRFRPWVDTHNLDEVDQLRIETYNGYEWKSDGFGSWELVQKVVDNHRAGKVGSDLAGGITRTKHEATWSC